MMKLECARRGQDAVYESQRLVSRSMQRIVQARTQLMLSKSRVMMSDYDNLNIKDYLAELRSGWNA